MRNGGVKATWVEQARMKEKPHDQGNCAILYFWNTKIVHMVCGKLYRDSET